MSYTLLEIASMIAGYARPVVGPISLGLRAGEILGLGGPNGAGKSTILRAITGRAHVFSGRIVRSDGLTISHQWQRPELPPELALLGRELFSLTGARPGDAPAMMKPLLTMPLRHMSGGQYQLLHTFACMCSPCRLVLMDEPTNNLDGRALDALSALLKKLDPGRAVLLVSHEKAFLEKHCTRIVEVGS